MQKCNLEKQFVK